MKIQARREKSKELWECEECGADVDKNDKNCPKCGTEFVGE